MGTNKKINIPVTKSNMPKFDSVKKQIKDMLDSGMITQSKYVEKFEKALQKYLNVKHTVTFPSGTAALIGMLSELPEGSEVILPSYTFSATYQALYWNRLIPVFVDCDWSGRIDHKEIKSKITDKTSAIVGVHMYGNLCNIEALRDIIKETKIKLFFDGAHSFGKGIDVCDCTMFSLGATKVMPVGEGGLLATNDDELAEKYKLFKDNGHKQLKLEMEQKGFNGRFQEFNAIIGLEQLKLFEENTSKRRIIASKYFNLLHFDGKIKIVYPTLININKSIIKDFVIRVKERDKVLEELCGRGINCKKYFYPPLHKQKFLSKYNRLKLKTTEQLSEEVLALPFYDEMTLEDVETVVKNLKEVVEHVQSKLRN